MIDIKEMHPFGIGTWGLAGYLDYDESVDKAKQLDALLYMQSKGLSYIDCSLKYADGEALKIISELVKKVGREKLFITAKLEQFINTKEDVRNQINTYKKVLGTDYIDQVQLHAPSFTKISIYETYKEMSKLVNEGQVRYLGTSNFNIEQIEEAISGSEMDIFSNESLFNFSFRQNEDVGILSHCRSRNMKFIAYQPLHRTKTVAQNFDLLLRLSEKYKVTQSQIILNWLVRKGIMPLIRSDNFKHIDENIDALTFTLEDEDFAEIDAFRIKDIVDAQVDWSDTGRGTPIYQLANLF